MKTFHNLIEDVQKPGLCHRCGGCVTFCTAVNYGALVLDAEGQPGYGDEDKCIECGLCYSICPEIDELDAETQKKLGWAPPIGRIIETGNHVELMKRKGFYYKLHQLQNGRVLELRMTNDEDGTDAKSSPTPYSVLPTPYPRRENGY